MIRALSNTYKGKSLEYLTLEALAGYRHTLPNLLDLFDVAEMIVETAEKAWKGKFPNL